MNEFRELAKKNVDFIWVFLFPLFFLIICTFVCLFPAFPNDKNTSINILLLVLGIVSALFSLVLVVFITIYLVRPDPLITTSIDHLRVYKTKNNYEEFSYKDIQSVEHRKFLNSQESVVVFKFKNTNKKDLIVRYCLDADKVALYLNQVIKNQ